MIHVIEDHEKRSLLYWLDPAVVSDASVRTLSLNFENDIALDIFLEDCIKLYQIRHKFEFMKKPKDLLAIVLNTNHQARSMTISEHLTKQLELQTMIEKPESMHNFDSYLTAYGTNYFFSPFEDHTFFDINKIKSLPQVIIFYKTQVYPNLGSSKKKVDTDTLNEPHTQNENVVLKDNSKESNNASNHIECKVSPELQHFPPEKEFQRTTLPKENLPDIEETEEHRNARLFNDEIKSLALYFRHTAPLAWDLVFVREKIAHILSLWTPLSLTLSEESLKDWTYISTFIRRDEKNEFMLFHTSLHPRVFPSKSPNTSKVETDDNIDDYEYEV